MVWLVGLVTVSLVMVLAAGVYFEFRPLTQAAKARRWLTRGVVGNLALFVLAGVALLAMVVGDALAQPAGEIAAEISIGKGLALIGVGIPTGLATIGAGIALGPVGAASLAVIAEKPEMLGRTLIFLGLAEGIAIYGLVVTIILLGRIG